MNEYELQAEKFLKDTGTTFKAVFLKHDLYFEGDTEERDIYEITLTREGRVYKFKFGQSTAESGFRLFHDKEKTKRTGHKGFKIPQEIRDKQKEVNEKNKDERMIFARDHIIRRWFQEEHFSLSELYWDFGKVPDSYDVLACLQKYDIGSFENFCEEFGYVNDSRKAEKIYNAVVDEWKNVQILWNDKEIEELQQIQ